MTLTAIDPVELSLGNVHQRLVLVGVAGVVDHDVEAAEGLDRFRHHGVDLGFLRHVDGDVAGGLADRLRHLPRALPVDVGDDDLGAFRGVKLADAAPEPRRTAGDDRNLAIETHEPFLPDIAVDCRCRDSSGSRRHDKIRACCPIAERACNRGTAGSFEDCAGVERRGDRATSPGAHIPARSSHRSAGDIHHRPGAWR